MKKILSLILSALLFAGALFLVSCTPEETPSESESKSESVSESVSESASESESEALPVGKAIYKIRFMNASGASVAEVGAQICGGPSEMCMPILDTDGDGVYTVEIRGAAKPIDIEDNYYVRINTLPTGYTAVEGYDLVTDKTGTFYKVLLNEATEFTITLKTAE